MDQHELLRRIARLESEVVTLREERIPSVDRSSRRRDRRLTFAYVFATVTVLTIAGLGSASALDGSNTVFSDDIVDGAVSASDIRDGGLGGLELRDGSLGGIDIGNSSVRGVDVQDGSLTGADVNLFDDGRCNGETVQGTASVLAAHSVPSTYTTGFLQWTHSCSGEPVQVRRSEPGVYYVTFGPSSPSRLALATAEWHPVIANVVNIAPGEFRVVLQLVTPEEPTGVRYLDVPFSILAY